MAAAPRLMTAREYYATPESLRPTELAFGNLHVADSPAAKHQSTVFALAIALNEHVRERAIGRIWISPLDVVLDEGRALIVQPDLMFISNERASIVGSRVNGAPDLVIEVLSPHPRVGSVSEHMRWFADYGVRECWQVQQDLHRVVVTAFRDHANHCERIVGIDEPIVSAVLPAFSLSLGAILASTV